MTSITIKYKFDEGGNGETRALDYRSDFHAPSWLRSSRIPETKYDGDNNSGDNSDDELAMVSRSQRLATVNSKARKDHPDEEEGTHGIDQKQQSGSMNYLKIFAMKNLARVWVVGRTFLLLQLLGLLLLLR